MKALITSIQFKKIDKKHCYWSITLRDVHGNLLEVFDVPKLSDSINFRTQTYGILTITNSYDLLRIFTETPTPLPVYVGSDSTNKNQYIKNHKGDIFKFDEEEYGIDKVTKLIVGNKKTRKEINAEIESIVSKERSIDVGVKTKQDSKVFSSPQLYYGFGYPLSDYKESNKSTINTATDMFRTFIEGILCIYNTTELLDLGRSDAIEYPIVEVLYDENGEINGIGSIETDDYLMIENGKYKIINKTPELKEEQKVRTLN
ncbi:MAG: hypothetical protein J1F35_05355 [Erysipelotrichales bacterium]|nr:hypothetical protein [Erysipelotrichales bacterium]